MPAEGMVHALKEIHRLLKPDGCLIDLHPIPEGAWAEVYHGDQVLFSERVLVDTLEDGSLAAEKALAKIVDDSLYAIDRQTEFDYLTLAPSVTELENHRAADRAYKTTPRDATKVSREEYLATKIEQFLQTANPAAEVAVRERIRVTLLRPLK